MIFVLFDLEATCWKNESLQREQEIIEIGAIKLDRFGDVMDSFQSFVKPELHPDLSYFCQDLTGIRQQDVDSSDLFDEVWDRFLVWMGYDEEEVIMASWGAKDEEFLQNALERYELADDILDYYIDLKAQYRRIKGLRRQVGLVNALKREGEDFDGEHHRAFDDAKNLLPIFTRHLDEWIF